MPTFVLEHNVEPNLNGVLNSTKGTFFHIQRFRGNPFQTQKALQKKRRWTKNNCSSRGRKDNSGSDQKRYSNPTKMAP